MTMKYVFKVGKRARILPILCLNNSRFAILSIFKMSHTIKTTKSLGRILGAVVCECDSDNYSSVITSFLWEVTLVRQALGLT